MRSRAFSVGMSGACRSIFKPDHQVVNGFLDSRDFDGDKVGDGNFAILGLANVESA